MTTPTTVQARFQLRADTAANWASVNPTLLNNEFGLETDTKKLKVGNGSTAWNSLAYFPSIVTGGTVLGNLEIGTTGTLTFEGSTADGFETTLGVVNPTADRTITLPNITGTVITTGDTGTVTSTMLADGTIVNADVNASAAIAHSKLANITAGFVLLGNASNVPTATALSGDVTINSSGVTAIGSGVIVDGDISATAEIAVSKLADGAARQVLQTDSAGTAVEWTDSLDLPGTLDVTQAATFDSNVTIQGDLTVNGTTTTIDTQNLIVEDKNVIIGNVTSPTDVTADGGGITLKGTTDKTISWSDTTNAWTSSEVVDIPAGTAAAPSLIFGGDVNTGLYSPGADQVAISTAGTGRLFIDASGRVGLGTSSPATLLHLSSATGSAAPTPTELRIATTTVASDWSTTDPWGRISYYSADLSDTGPKIIAAIDAVSTNAAGGRGRLDFKLSEVTTGTLTSRLVITEAGLVGIGITSPLGKTHIQSSSTGLAAVNNAGDELVIENNGTTGMTILSSNTSTGTIYFADSDSPQPGAIQYDHSDNNLNFRINNGERARIDSSGRLLVGTSTAFDVRVGLTAITPQQQLAGLNQSNSTFAIACASTTDASAGWLWLAKYASGTIGTNTTAVNADERLGNITFSGSDGSNQTQAASISAAVDGTPGTDDMPGRLVLSTTADGASGSTERLRINSSGTIFCGNGETAASPASSTISATSGAGTNIGGATLTIQGGRGTGTGTGGPIVFSTAAAGTTGTTLNAATERARLTSTGALLVGTSTTPTGAKASSLTVNEQLLVSPGLGIYSGLTGNITATTGTIVFTFKNTTVNQRAAMVKVSVATRSTSNTASNSPCAEYQFQLFKTSTTVCTLNGAASIYEYTFVRATHFAFADAGSGVCTVTLTNPTGQPLVSQYKVEILGGDGSLSWTLDSVAVT